MFTIRGVDFDIDILDADVMERLEDAAEKIQKRVAEEKAKKYKKNSEFIRVFNGLTEKFIDEVLGEGSSELIFGGSQNMMEHMEAYNGIFAAKEEAMSAVTEFTETFQNTYSPNRAQRRAAAKGKGKS
ncbi:DUF6673 family protein [Parablautia intestinalis]|uniref:DUF6673 family protein n=1 Tax=Parablautia intestinalis TaxID=2320100 RepID=UPI0023C0DB08|nr:DUF6673 family protein [Parablautia intestinalis]MDE6388962.1 hypothetical protein [Lachnospiraceae bacterium]